MKEKIRKEYYRRIRLVAKYELNSVDRIEAINTLAIPVVAYSFNIIHWKLEEIRKLDRKTRKPLTLERMHHPKSDVDKLFLPKSEGGRSLIQLETAYKTTTIGLDTYLNTKNDFQKSSKTKEKVRFSWPSRNFLEESSTSLIHRYLKMILNHPCSEG